MLENMTDTDTVGGDSVQEEVEETLAFGLMGAGGFLGEGGLTEIAETVTRVKMYPHFEIAHYILVCMLVREDAYSSHIAGSKGFHRNHPLACWIGSMMLCFAPSLLSNFLIGEPLLLLFNNQLHITQASIVWYLVNYCPLDLVYLIVKFLPIQVLLQAMEEVLRLARIHEGSTFATHNFAGAIYFVCFFGTLKGTAVLHMRVLQRLVCGRWMPYHMELLEPSPISKAALLAGVCFSLYHRQLIQAPFAIVYTILLLVLFVVKFFWAAFGVDAFKLVETFLCFVAFGGFLDWLDARRHRKEFEHLGQDVAKNKKHK